MVAAKKLDGVVDRRNGHDIASRTQTLYSGTADRCLSGQYQNFVPRFVQINPEPTTNCANTILVCERFPGQ
jgi:hypothetical protein